MSIKILVGGDFSQDWILNKKQKKSCELWGNMLPFLHESVLRIVNLECPFTASTKEI